MRLTDLHALEKFRILRRTRYYRLISGYPVAPFYAIAGKPVATPVLRRSDNQQYYNCEYKEERYENNQQIFYEFWEFFVIDIGCATLKNQLQ